MKDRRIIINKGFTYQRADEFWNTVQDAFDAGYRYDKSYGIKEAAVFRPNVRVCLVKSEDSGESSDVTISRLESDLEDATTTLEIYKACETLESTFKKAELFEFAKLHSIEVPEDMNKPAAIKKHIKEIIEARK